MRLLSCTEKKISVFDLELTSSKMHKPIMRQNSIQFDNIFVECHHISAVMVFYFNLFFSLLLNSEIPANQFSVKHTIYISIDLLWLLLIFDHYAYVIAGFFIRMHVNDDFIMHQKRQQTEILCVSAHINWRERERKKLSTISWISSYTE